MGLESTNFEKVRKFVVLVKNELATVVMIAMAIIIYYQATWIKELTHNQHLEDKEYMIFFRDQYNETNKYLNYSRKDEDSRTNSNTDTLHGNYR